MSVQCLSFDGRDSVVAAGDVSGRILLWHGFMEALAKGKVPAVSTVHWHAHPVGCVAFSADSTFMLSGGQEGVLVSCADYS